MLQSSDERHILLRTIEVACETLVYGIFAVVVLVLLHAQLALSQTKLRTTGLWLILCMFVLSTVHLAASVVSLVTNITGVNDNTSGVVRNFINALVGLNLLCADATIVWRMRVLCASYIPSQVLLIPATMLGASSIFVFLVIGLRLVTTITTSNRDIPLGPLTTLINVSQMAIIVFSLLSNVSATTIIGFWAWRLRRTFRRKAVGHQTRRTQGEKLVFLLLETGGLYSASAIVLLVVTPIPILVGTVGDIYNPVHAQISGIYMALVIILAKKTDTTPVSTLGNVPQSSDPRNGPAMTSSGLRSRKSANETAIMDLTNDAFLATKIPSPGLHLEHLLSPVSASGRKC
ncbi:hypothetical protein BDW22DRAFT_517049 [Trametopsis cervina]|nr:hypothetical protein BDW22DRAFT_517049 [Trametopsis cervina]